MRKIDNCFFYLLIISMLAAGCAQVQHIARHKIKRLVKRSAINQDHLTGFALYDPAKQKMIYAENADKHFTPASNTKLFTFYTALQMLGDSIPGLRYITKGDSLIFWGTGDPSFLHSVLKSTKAYDLLKASTRKLFYVADNYDGEFYGAGWTYDDYQGYYQADITALPLEDNLAVIAADGKGGLQIKPSLLQIYLQPDSSYRPQNFRVKRSIFENKFSYPTTIVPPGFRQQIPWKTSVPLTIALLQDTLKKPIWLIKMQMPDFAKTLYTAATDSVYKHMLQPSDNFIAEQLLLVCSSVLPGDLSTDKVIVYSTKHYLQDLPDAIQWADGSGLSRLDQFTPRSIIALLQKIRLKVNNDQKLFSLLPAGGVSGTLRRAYATDKGSAFVFAKTGSLSNVYNQSGYLLTRKGKLLLFSYMNNGFLEPTATIRQEMARIMTAIHDRF